jgi:hypothetical protein
MRAQCGHERLADHLAAVFAVVGVQPTVHTLDNIRVKPDDHTLNLFFIIACFHMCSPF